MPNNKALFPDDQSSIDALAESIVPERREAESETGRFKGRTRKYSLEPDRLGGKHDADCHER